MRIYDRHKMMQLKHMIKSLKQWKFSFALRNAKSRIHDEEYDIPTIKIFHLKVVYETLIDKIKRKKKQFYVNCLF